MDEAVQERAGSEHDRFRTQFLAEFGLDANSGLAPHQHARGRALVQVEVLGLLHCLLDQPAVELAVDLGAG